MNILSEHLNGFFQWTAWEMEKPKPYGAFHITLSLVGFLIAVLLSYHLRHIGERGNRILILTVGSILVISEVYKQLFYYYVIGNGSYQWWIFPFQLCSVPMYLCFLAPFVKRDRIRNALYSFMMLYNLLGGFIAFLEPSGIVHSYWTLTIHAFFWHMTLVFLGLYLFFSGHGRSTARDYRDATVVFLISCVLAFTINVLLYDVSGGSVNMFFLGPPINSIIVFSDIAKAAGWYVSTLLYIPTVCLGAFLLSLPFRHMGRKLGLDKM